MIVVPMKGNYSLKHSNDSERFSTGGGGVNEIQFECLVIKLIDVLSLGFHKPERRCT